MRTPPTNSPPSSTDEMSPPASPLMRDPLYQELNVGGVMLQVSEVMADNDADVSGQVGRMRREEREIMLAEAAENEKLLDKDWRDG
jgi:hypothetical protein